MATRHQLTTAAGVPDGTITSRTRPGGPWQRLLPRVYLLQTGPPDRRQRALAAVLYAAEPTTDPLSGDTAALTGGAALALLGIREAPYAPADVLIRAPRRLTATAGVRPLATPLWNARLHTPDGTFLAGPDAYWPDEGVALEIDSAEYHYTRDSPPATAGRCPQARHPPPPPAP